MQFTWWKKFFPAQPTIPADPDSPAWLRQVAMLTGILAGVAGYLTVRSADLSNNAIYQSSQAVLNQAMASDKWAEYQAVSIKARIIETATRASTTMPWENLQALQKDDAAFRISQDQLKKDASELENNRNTRLNGGQHLLDEKAQLGYAGMAVQLAIALASVAALTRRKNVFNIAIGIGTMGILITGYAFYLHFKSG